MPLAHESLTLIGKLNDAFALIYCVALAAAAAAIMQTDVHAARFFGAADAAATRTGMTMADPLSHSIRDRWEKPVRDRMSISQWNRAYAAGKEASIDTLIQEIHTLW
jgi:hypothetical protein